MTKRLIILASILFLPTLVHGAVFKAGDQVFLDQPTRGSAYLAGGSVYTLEAISGDLLAAGGNISATASTSQDVMLAGGEVNLSNAVGGDARLVGGRVNVRADVAGDLVILGGEVQIAPESLVHGDLVVAAGTVLVSGAVSGQANLNGGDVTINGPISGDVLVRAGHLTLGRQALIKGKLTYYSGEAAVLTPGAKVLGQTDYHFSEQFNNKARPWRGWSFGTLLIKFLVLWLGASLLGTLLGKQTPKIVGDNLNRFWKNLLLGLGFFLLWPIVAILFCISLIGLPLGISLFVVYLCFLALACLLVPLMVGTWLRRRFQPGVDHSSVWRTAAWGAIILVILALVPFLGPLVGLLLMWSTLGALVHWFYNLRHHD